MKKLAYMFVFSFAAVSLISCGASSGSCVSTEKVQIKNIKFENETIVVSKDLIEDGTITKHTFINSKFNNEVIIVSNNVIENSNTKENQNENKKYENESIIVSSH